MAEQIITKACSSCKQIKALSEFSKNRTRPDGLQYQCKTCRNSWKKQYRQTEQGKAAERAYFKTGKGKESTLNATRHYRKSKKGKLSRKCYVLHHSKEQKARKKVEYAIRTGKLPPADSLQCHYCDKRAKDYHHYKGYELEHSLDVVPICRKCHSRFP